MNQVILMGRLTADPQINDRITCASFTLAVDRKYKKDGEQNADFITCKLLGEKRTDFASKYLRKGTKIIVSGSIQTGSYEKDGRKIYTTDVIVDTTEFAESKNASQQNESKPQPMPQANDGFMNIPREIDESLPFN